VLISGAGWAGDLEHQARLLARKRGIPSVAVLDDWLNYRERFWRDGEEVLPDQHWVADAQAADVAKATIPNVPVLQLPSQSPEQLAQEVEEIRCRIKLTTPYYPAKRLLSLVEPLRDHKCGKPNRAGFEAMIFWLGQMTLLTKSAKIHNKRSEIKLYLRPHPNDPPGKYNFWIKSQTD